MADRGETVAPTAMLASVVASRGDLERLTRTILEILGRATGLESTYLTVVDWAESQQTVLFAQNTGELTVPEGTEAEWGDTLCRRALLTGTHVTANVAQARISPSALRSSSPRRATRWTLSRWRRRPYQSDLSCSGSPLTTPWCRHITR